MARDPQEPLGRGRSAGSRFRLRRRCEWFVLLLLGCAEGVPSEGGSLVDVHDVSDDDVSVETDVAPAEDASALDTVEFDIADADDVAETPTGWLAVVPDAESLAAFAVDGGPVKYLSVLEGATPPAPFESGCLFQDMHLWEYHIEFLRSFPELAGLPYDDYLAMVLKRPSRVLWGGAVQAWPQVKHPRTGQPGIVTYLVYSEPGVGSLRAEDLVEVDAQLEACLPYAHDRIVFVPGDEYQRQLVIGAATALQEGDVDVISPGALPPR